MPFELLVSAAIKAGADKAAVISASDVVLAESFREICETNQCGNFGRNWACPPYEESITELMDEVRSYDYCLLYQIISPLEDSFDFEGMMDAGEKLSNLGQKLNEALPELPIGRCLHLSGSCRLCEHCSRLDGKPCRMPNKALRSVSGYCIDIYSTTKATGLKYINGQNTVTNFGLVLFSE